MSAAENTFKTGQTYNFPHYSDIQPARPAVVTRRTKKSVWMMIEGAVQECQMRVITSSKGNEYVYPIGRGRNKPILMA